MNNPLKQFFDPLWRVIKPTKAYDIGLHIGHERINMLQLQPGPRPTIRAAASLKHGTTRKELITNSALLKKLIKRAFAEQPFHGKRVVTCLPGEQVNMLLLNYRVDEGESESDSISRELRKRVGEELDGMVVDYIPVRQEQPSRPKEAIIAMAAKDKVLAYLDVLSEAGLQVASLDVASAALARLMSWINAVETIAFPNLMLINLGSFNSYLTVVWGRRLMLDRPINFSEQRLLMRLKSILDIDETEGARLLFECGTGSNFERDDVNEVTRALKEVLRPEFSTLTTEVNNTLVYTASRTHGRSVDSIYVVGNIARYPGFEKLLADEFSIPIKTLDPCAIFKHKLTDKELSWLQPCSGFSTATGLALRGVPVLWPTST
jgi:type IV pilus assembly protein PilM